MRTVDGETSWDLTLDARELIDPLLADFCEEWFGFRRMVFASVARLSLGLAGGQLPTIPVTFAPSRYFFQPHPGERWRRSVKRTASPCGAP